MIQQNSLLLFSVFLVVVVVVVSVSASSRFHQSVYHPSRKVNITKHRLDPIVGDGARQAASAQLVAGSDGVM